MRHNAMLMQSCSLRCNGPILQRGQNTTPTQALHLSHHSNTSLCDIRIRVIPVIPPSASPFPIHRTGLVSVGRFHFWVYHFPNHSSLRLHIIGLGENPTCTNPSNLQIFINPNPFRDNMTDSIIEKIRKAAEARDKAIKEQAQKGICAPCDEPLASCMCDAYEDMAGEE